MYAKHIKKLLDDNKPIFIITKDLDFYKENGKHIFFENEKEAYDYTIGKGLEWVTLYLSKYRLG